MVLAGATVANSILGGTYSDDFNLSSTESGEGSSALSAHGVATGTNTARIVFSTGSGGLSAQKSAIESGIDRLRDTAHVVSASDPLATGTTSKNGRVAYSTVRFDDNPITLGESLVDDVNRATDPVRSAGVAVDYTGNLGKAAVPATGDLRAELIGILIAIIVLLLGVRRVIAAGLPILTSLVGVATALAGLGLLASQVTFAKASPTLAIMIGLGVGIDYALFIVTRHRQQLTEGHRPGRRGRLALATAGRAVLFAGMTVVIALLGLFAVGIPFIGKLGLGRRDRRRGGRCRRGDAGARAARLRRAGDRPAPRAAGPSPRSPPTARRALASGTRWAARQRHPWRYLIGSVLVVLILAIPALSLQLGHRRQRAPSHDATPRGRPTTLTEGFGRAPTARSSSVSSRRRRRAHATRPDARPASQTLGRRRASRPPRRPANEADDAAALAVIPPPPRRTRETADLVTTCATTSIPPVIDGHRRAAYVGGCDRRRSIDIRRHRVRSGCRGSSRSWSPLSFLLLMVVFRVDPRAAQGRGHEPAVDRRRVRRDRRGVPVGLGPAACRRRHDRCRSSPSCR